jgi:hypothetical protein
MKELREKALEWWKSLDSSIQLQYWREYQNYTFTPSGSPEQLTGREIQNIWESKFDNYA